jgi:hypothetical protein
MKSKPATPLKQIETVRAHCRAGTPETILELIALQLERVDESNRRISEEGTVVRDMKGSVIAHPSIMIEANATKLAVDLLSKYRGR